MSVKTLRLNDSMAVTDRIKPSVNSKQRTLWNRTEILIGYGRYTDNRGISQLQEVVFEEENMVPIGGVQYAMEKLFGVRGPINTDFLNNTHGIGSQSPAPVIGYGNGYPMSIVFVCLV